MWNRVLIFLGYLYLLRVPVLALGHRGRHVVRVPLGICGRADPSCEFYDVASVSQHEPYGTDLMERLFYVTLQPCSRRQQ